ncbi:hypothetical protein KAU33_15995 [Candidatus Dependentiae bacterium]|nr:hypothetical protein [Candidatus Dependentiae bacterium]
MTEELRSGELTWKDLKDRIKIAGVDDKTLVECTFLDIRETKDLMMLGLSTTRKMNGIFEPKINDNNESDGIKRYRDKIKILNEELDELRLINDENKCRILMLGTQIDKLVSLISTCQDKLLEVSKEIIEKQVFESMFRN